LISIVTGTLSRLPALKELVYSIRNTCALDYEIILVDGGSKDGTEEWCLKQPDIVFIQQGKRMGAVAAFNAGFAIARGEFTCNLNDDCLVVGDVFGQAIKQFEESRVGQVAIPYKDPTDKKPKCEMIYLGKPRHDILYANFGITRTWLGKRLGWWGNDVYHYGGDTDLSVKIWDAGYAVVELDGDGYIQHLRLDDDTRVDNNDSRHFFSKWEQWCGPYPEPRFTG